MEDLRTSEEWQKVCSFKILDPDGWARHGDFNYSWYEEKITREEFEKRMMISTCEFRLDRKTWVDKK